MAKIHFYVDEPTTFAKRMICITLTEDGYYVVESEGDCIVTNAYAPSEEEMNRADMLAKMQTGKPFSMVEDYC